MDIIKKTTLPKKGRPINSIAIVPQECMKTVIKDFNMC